MYLSTKDLVANGSMDIITSAVARGRPASTDIVPGTVLRHFLYKSRANVQFFMPSYENHFSSLVARRRLNDTLGLPRHEYYANRR